MQEGYLKTHFTQKIADWPDLARLVANEELVVVTLTSRLDGFTVPLRLRHEGMPFRLRTLAY
jgi:hypothetical protein